MKWHTLKIAIKQTFRPPKAKRDSGRANAILGNFQTRTEIAYSIRIEGGIFSLLRSRKHFFSVSIEENTRFSYDVS